MQPPPKSGVLVKLFFLFFFGQMGCLFCFSRESAGTRRENNRTNIYLSLFFSTFDGDTDKEGVWVEEGSRGGNIGGLEKRDTRDGKWRMTEEEKERKGRRKVDRRGKRIRKGER